MNPKYRMTREDNIFVAKRNIVDYIWKSAKLEGLNVTFPETYAIYEQAKLKDIDVDTVMKIINLKQGWRLLLNTLGKPLDLPYICALHYEVARGEALEWGKLRAGRVGIAGTNYVPPIPKEETVKAELADILTIKSPTERAIALMLWGMKSQLFWDGNKRTSMLAANKVMIENGCGILSVPNELILEFNSVLSDYYTNDTFEAAKCFVYENCIDGMDFEAEASEPPAAEDEDEWDAEL
jgi:Fic family protein